MKKYVIFDLDGTIIDSAEGILNGFDYVMKFYGKEYGNKGQFMKYIGPPLYDSMLLEFGEERAAEALQKYREYYSHRGQFEIRVYDGVEELLRRLNAAGCTLMLATSKKESLARSIMEHTGLNKYFAFIAGEDGELRPYKAQVMQYALDSVGAAAADAIMVGDRKYDIESAHELGMPCVAVLYGFGKRDEFEKYSADIIAETPAGVYSAICK